MSEELTSEGLPPITPPEIAKPLDKEPPKDLYNESSLVVKLSKQTLTTPPAAFFSDLDGTYTRKPRLGETVDDVRAETQAVTTYLDNMSVPLVGSTGRDLPLVVAGQTPESENLPKFDAIIASVGTEIFVLQPDGTYVPDLIYEERIKTTTHFDRGAVVDVSKTMLEKMQKDRPGIALAFQPRDQPDSKEPPQQFKVSFNFYGDDESRKFVEAQFREMLDSKGLTKTHVVAKAHGNGQSGWNLDILAATKADAINYMMDKLGCQGVVAGDSGNDSTMILGSNSQAGIAVGNSNPELREEIAKHPSLLKPQQRGPNRRSDRIIGSNGVEKILYNVPAGQPDAGPGSLLRALKFFRCVAAVSNLTQNQ